MSIKTKKDRFSLNRQKQKSTLELWQQHLQALRRASHCPQAGDKSQSKRQNQLPSSQDESPIQSRSDVDTSTVKTVQIMAKASPSFEHSARER